MSRRYIVPGSECPRSESTPAAVAETVVFETGPNPLLVTRTYTRLPVAHVVAESTYCSMVAKPGCETAERSSVLVSRLDLKTFAPDSKALPAVTSG